MNAKQRTEYAKWLGSRTSAKKAQASRENGKKGGRPPATDKLASHCQTVSPPKRIPGGLSDAEHRHLKSIGSPKNNQLIVWTFKVREQHQGTWTGWKRREKHGQWVREPFAGETSHTHQAFGGWVIVDDASCHHQQVETEIIPIAWR